MPAFSGAAADPAQSGYAVTTSDSVALPNGPCRALYIGGTGDVSVLHNQVNANGGFIQVTVVYKTAPVGILPVSCVRVNATGTTATSIVALY